MKKDKKNKLIELLNRKIKENKNFYLADISGLTAEETSNLRRLCFKRNVSLNVVKNTLLRKALDLNEIDFNEIYDLLKGNTSIMFSKSNSVPAKLIKEFRKKHDKPLLKVAHIDEETYIGEEHLNSLASLKTKDELISEILTLLKSPVENVLTSLLSSGNKISDLLKELEKNASK
tara:strand:+ start:1682 stop:2206 length:525 start_codon:yes stop_codon:yes gene_type:complete